MRRASLSTTLRDKSIYRVMVRGRLPKDVESRVSNIHAASIFSALRPAQEHKDPTKHREIAPTAGRVRDDLAGPQAGWKRSGKPTGRLRLDRDFMAIRDALTERRDEPGVVARMAREFEVSRGWLQKWIIPILESLSGTPAEDGRESESTNPSG